MTTFPRTFTIVLSEFKNIDTSINIVILASTDVRVLGNIKQYQTSQTDHKWLLLMMMRMIIAEIYSDFDYFALLSD